MLIMLLLYMITLLKNPTGVNSILLGDMLRLYAKENSIPYDNRSLYRLSTVPGYVFLTIYKHLEPIGFVSYSIENRYMVAGMVYLLPAKRRYFKTVIHAMDRLAQSFGLSGIVTNPDNRTKKIYDRHNIGKEITV